MRIFFLADIVKLRHNFMSKGGKIEVERKNRISKLLITILKYLEVKT